MRFEAHLNAVTKLLLKGEVLDDDEGGVENFSFPFVHVAFEWPTIRYHFLLQQSSC